MTGKASIRQILVSQLWLGSVVGSQLGIPNHQLSKLRRGDDVVIERAQLEGFVAAVDLEQQAGVTDLTIAEHWRLTGDAQLTPIDE